MKKLLAVATLLVLSGSLAVAALVASSAPSFAPATSYATGYGPWSVAIGDLNGDGNPDLATANLNGRKTVSVLLNKGTAASSPSTTTQFDASLPRSHSRVGRPSNA